MAGSDGEHEESSSEGSGSDSNGADIEALQITQEMGRAVVDLQVENINGLNEKAAQTIRFNVLILGVVLTIFSLIFKNGGEAVQAKSMLNGATGGAVMLSGVSILAALWTYTSSRKEVGATGPAMEQVIADDATYSQRQWLQAVIRSQSNWIAENERVNRADAVSLFISHLYLFVSIGLYAFGVAWGLNGGLSMRATTGVQFSFLPCVFQVSFCCRANIRVSFQTGLRKQLIMRRMR